MNFIFGATLGSGGLMLLKKSKKSAIANAIFASGYFLAWLIKFILRYKGRTNERNGYLIGTANSALFTSLVLWRYYVFKKTAAIMRIAMFGGFAGFFNFACLLDILNIQRKLEAEKNK
ncbi:hypothetical protein MHBO_001484 [Bonamia ostreae]|uniref:Uncharacterized protein n=1 Tax=Bonamia ostreae TaxID=126728 RepID=A0ABV2AJ50_9EUKA